MPESGYNSRDIECWNRQLEHELAKQVNILNCPFRTRHEKLTCFQLTDYFLLMCTGRPTNKIVGSFDVLRRQKIREKWEMGITKVIRR